MRIQEQLYAKIRRMDFPIFCQKMGLRRTSNIDLPVKSAISILVLKKKIVPRQNFQTQQNGHFFCSSCPDCYKERRNYSELLEVAYINEKPQNNINLFQVCKIYSQ